MRRTSLTVLLALALASRLNAQSSEADLKARLEGKTLFLRDLYGGDDLRFDSDGRLMGKPSVTSFTLGEMKIRNVKLTSGGLILDGTRIGLVFHKDVPARVTLKIHNKLGLGTHDEEMRLQVKASPDGNFSKALDVIFTPELGDLIPSLPSYWVTFVRAHLAELQTLTPLAYERGKTQPATGLERVGGSVTAPRVSKMPEPSFSPQARALMHSGDVLVYLQVDEAGHPGHIRILRALGAGLDEQAVGAVEQYVFAPALRNGTPVPVEMNVNVNFAIF